MTGWAAGGKSMTISIPEMVIGAIVEMGVEGVWETAKRRETILRLLKKLGYSLDHPPPDFDGLYAYLKLRYNFLRL
jgi:hypothetical protein